MNRLKCFLFGHIFYVDDIVRDTPDQVHCPCDRCKKIFYATYGLALKGQVIFYREEKK